MPAEHPEPMMEQESRGQADQDALLRYMEMIVLFAVTAAYLYLVQAVVRRVFSLSATFEDTFALAGICGLVSLWWMLFSVRAEPTSPGKVPWVIAGGLALGVTVVVTLIHASFAHRLVHASNFLIFAAFLGSPLIMLLDRLRVLVHLRRSGRAAEKSRRIPARSARRA
jgi:hypothetical protein